MMFWGSFSKTNSQFRQKCQFFWKKRKIFGFRTITFFSDLLGPSIALFAIAFYGLFNLDWDVLGQFWQEMKPILAKNVNISKKNWQFLFFDHNLFLWLLRVLNYKAIAHFRLFWTFCFEYTKSPFLPKMKKLPKLDKLTLKGYFVKFFSPSRSSSVLTIKTTLGEKISCLCDTFEIFVNFEILVIFEIFNN